MLASHAVPILRFFWVLLGELAAALLIALIVEAISLDLLVIPQDLPKELHNLQKD